MTQPPFFLFAEDDDDDWFLIEESFDESAPPDGVPDIVRNRVKDGQELLTWLDSPSKPQPNLILMDLKMPKINGHEALDAIRANPAIKHLPVLILTTSTSERDVYTSYYKGANSYLVKPLTTSGARALRAYWSHLSRLPCNSCGDSCLEYGCTNR